MYSSPSFTCSATAPSTVVVQEVQAVKPQVTAILTTKNNCKRLFGLDFLNYHDCSSGLGGTGFESISTKGIASQNRKPPNHVPLNTP